MEVCVLLVVLKDRLNSLCKHAFLIPCCVCKQRIEKLTTLGSSLSPAPAESHLKNSGLLVDHNLLFRKQK